MKIEFKLEGKIEGKTEEKFEVAKNAKIEGLPLELIIKLTGLTKEDIENI
ncbi:MAG: hypothetical protein H7263_05835 [Candidatus Sericytochromatia bacterium]|nr:hypothetical protein [Candidatus Sericytochromatia bacterium]